MEMTAKKVILTNLLIVVLCSIGWSSVVLVSIAEAEPEWQATIRATMPGVKGEIVLGADPTATDGLDKVWDSFAKLEGQLRAYFPRPEWGVMNQGTLYFDKYWQDIRAKAPGKTTEWSFKVEADAANAAITLTWDLSLMPGDYPVSLIDDSNNQTTDMRTNASYSFTYTAARNFRVSVYTPAPVEPPPVNRPPVANAGSDQVLEMASCGGAEVILDGAASTDPDGDTLSYTWTWDGGSAEGTGPKISLPMGTTVITLTVDDGKGGSSSDTVKISINDTKVEILKVDVTPKVLWPANRKYVKVTPTVTVSDVCIPKTKVELLSVTSNEPEGLNENAGGKTTKDIVIQKDG